MHRLVTAILSNETSRPVRRSLTAVPRREALPGNTQRSWFSRLAFWEKAASLLACLIVIGGFAVGVYKLFVGPRDPARVLLAIDISGSANNELLAGDPRTRIEAAQEWAGRALDSLDDRDQLGIATFSTSDPVPRLVVPIRALTEQQKVRIRAGLQKLPARSGGTPLYQSIAWGVERLQENWEESTKQALVVLTDGEENASKNVDEQQDATTDATDRLKASDQAGKDVEVLITAVTLAAECRQVPKRFYDKCYPVATEGDLRRALNGILDKLGLPVPSA